MQRSATLKPDARAHRTYVGQGKQDRRWKAAASRNRKHRQEEFGVLGLPEQAEMELAAKLGHGDAEGNGRFAQISTETDEGAHVPAL